MNHPTRDPSALAAAMWSGDTDKLQELAPCACCCAEHTFGQCPARAWGGCRGQDSTEIDIEGWAMHYGMTPERFLRIEGP